MSRPALIQLGIIAGIAIIFSSLIFWLKSDIGARALRVQVQQKELASRSISLNSLSTLKADAAKARAFSSLLENTLQLKDQLIHFPRDIEEVARRNGLEFGSSFGEERAATEIAPGYIGFLFTIGGDYDRIVNFLREVERGRYIVQWGSIDLAERDGAYRGSIAGKVFSR